MLAPMLVQMERQIDREIAADNKANGVGCGTQTGNGCSESGTQTEAPSVGAECAAVETDLYDSDTENEDEDDKDPMLMYGPQPQIVTNDLKSLDEMVSGAEIIQSSLQHAAPAPFPQSLFRLLNLTFECVPVSVCVCRFRGLCFLFYFCFLFLLFFFATDLTTFCYCCRCSFRSYFSYVHF